VLWKALQPMRQILAQKNDLPKALWFSTLGAFALDTLAQSIVLDEYVRTPRKAIAELDADILLLGHLEGDGASQTINHETANRLASRLDDQLLTDLREEAISQLQALLRDGDPAVVLEREWLCEALVNFIELQIDVAVTEAGYHVVPTVKQMQPQDMLQRAQELIAAIEARLAVATPVGRYSGENAQLKLNFNRATALALLSFPHFAKKRAMHVEGSTIAGRISFLAACIKALEPEPAVPGAQLDVVGFRLKGAYDRMTKALGERVQQFGRDLDSSASKLAQAAKAVRQVSLLREKLS
jgi:hypothetical protein